MQKSPIINILKKGSIFFDTNKFNLLVWIISCSNSYWEPNKKNPESRVKEKYKIHLENSSTPSVDKKNL